MQTFQQATGAALSGVRVVDLTTVIYGPYATMTLADYGADVIKVEAPGGDSTRHTGPSVQDGMATLFLGSNRNKRSIVLDLKTAAGQEAMQALLATADVFIHNVRPQKLDAIGLDARTVCQRHPQLIFVGLHGFGEGGPYAGRPAYDDIVQALSGASDLVRRQADRAAYMPTVLADKTSGMMAVQAVMAALLQRTRSGQGQVIEVPMFEATTAYLLAEHFYARHFAGRNAEAQAGDEADFGYPRTLAGYRRPYAASDGHVCVMPYSDSSWRRFFQATGHADLADDPRFATLAQRTRHIATLYQLVADIVAQHPTAYWISLCETLDIPNAPVNRLQDLEQDPHLRAVDFFVDVTSDDGTTYRFPRHPVRMSASQVAPVAPPRLGQHTEQLLQELGLPPSLVRQILADANPQPSSLPT